MAKGGANERAKCKDWSLWWSDGRRDDVFWRTSGSGARARVRTNAGKATAAMFGDMHAVDDEGLPLVRTCVFEFKKGYPDLGVLCCLDGKRKKPVLHEFFEQVMQDADDAGGLYPVLVVHRDYRRPVMFIPDELYNKLVFYYGRLQKMDVMLKYYWGDMVWVAFKQDVFFEWASANFFKELYDRKRREA